MSALEAVRASDTLGADGRPWRLAEPADDAVARIRRAANCDDLTARILALRGVSPNDAPSVLRPRLRDLLPDPNVLTHMERAATRIADALGRDETVAVFADYDADGLTAGALVVDFLRAFGARPITYVPDRLTEGYGPSPTAMRALAEAGARLVVMVDCGANAPGALTAALEAGLDVVVFDHHPMDGPAFDAPRAAIVNPQRPDDRSGLSRLAAGGVAFLGCIASARALKTRGVDVGAYDPLASLDLAAVGAVCDMMPLTGLNRALVAQGLRVLEHGARPGFAALAAAARLRAPYGAQDIGFGFGPRLNAAGRMGRAGIGLELLTTQDPRRAEALAAELEALNRARRAQQAAMTEEALELAAADGASDQAIVVGREGWSPGLAGLAASKLVERFGRPAVVIAFEDAGPSALGRGSGRSVSGVDLGALIRRAHAEGFVRSGGGHAMAAGLTVARDRFDALRAFLAEKAPTAPPPGPRHADFTFGPSGARTSRAAIRALEPFGEGFKEPVGLLQEARLTAADVFGADHIRFQFTDARGCALAGVAFGVAGEPLGTAAKNLVNTPVEALGRLTDDPYRGVGFQVIDLRAAPRAD